MDKLNIDLDRFLEAQERTFEQALSEIRSGRKSSHWMWYIFPQIKGLGLSSTAQFYSIQTPDEAREYLNHPVLGCRLRQMSTELLLLEERDALKIFGSPDHLKLNSSMTLFSVYENNNDNVFKKVIDKFFHGEPDARTINLIRSYHE